MGIQYNRGTWRRCEEKDITISLFKKIPQTLWNVYFLRLPRKQTWRQRICAIFWANFTVIRMKEKGK